MSGGGKLVVKQSYGVNRSMKNCISFTIDHHLAYPCGHQVAIINTETKEQNFIPATNTYQHQSLGITAVTASLFKKTLAIAEKCEPHAIITFYDSHTLRRKKLVNSPDIGSNEIKCLAFSNCGKYFISQGCGPDWNLVLWSVEKTVKILSSIKISLSDDLPVNQISFCPWDSTVILVIGVSIFRLFRWIEGQLRPINCIVRRDHANFISHCWIPDDALVLGTAGGELLLVENLEYRGVIYPTSADAMNLPLEELTNPINCMMATPRGFLVGTTNSDFRVFERNDDIKEKYQFEDSFKLPGQKGSIIAFAMGTDDTLVCATDKQQLLYTSFSNLAQNKETAAGGGGFENIFTAFHHPYGAKRDASITGIDVALWKNIVVTCGKDRTLRVWNPNDKKMEYMKEFEEEPLSLSVHPSGIYVAVAFTEYIKIFSLLLDEITVVRVLQAKNISYCKFSRGGHYIAAAVGTNLQVYNTIDGSTVCTLRGHNNRVKSVVWMNYDSRIMSVGVEGSVYSWDLFPQQIMQHKRLEHYAGTAPISAGAGPSDGSKLYVAAHDHTVKEILFGATAEQSNAGQSASGNIVPSAELDLPYNISCMLYDEARKMLLMGTANTGQAGIIICTTTNPQLSPSVEYNHIHSTGITAICQSYDGNTIYSGDSSGNLSVSEFENSTFNPGKQLNTKREGIVSFDFVEEVVIHKSDLEHRRHQIEQLSLRVDELNQNNDHQIRLKEIEHKDKVTEISEKFNEQLEFEKKMFNGLSLIHI